MAERNIKCLLEKYFIRLRVNRWKYLYAINAHKLPCRHSLSQHIVFHAIIIRHKIVKTVFRDLGIGDRNA